MLRKYLALVALSCVACSSTLSATGPAVTPNAVISASPVAQASGSPAATIRIGELTFGPPTADDLRAMMAFGITGELVMPFRPLFHGAMSTARQIQNGNYELESYLRSPFGDQWGTASVLTARAQASAGTDRTAYVQNTGLPLVKAWAEDGQLFTTYSRVPNLADQRAGIVRSHDPNETANEGAILKNVGWPLAYVSESKRTALFFYEVGVVLHVQWAEKHHSEQNVPVTKAAAIKTVVAALRDPAATSEEARTGLDHFLNIPYAGVFGPPEVNRHDDLVPTYDVPDAVDWNGFLGVEYAEKPVWYINSTWGGGGQVDALTGALIRFTRLRVGHGTGGPPSPFVPPAP